MDFQRSYMRIHNPLCIAYGSVIWNFIFPPFFKREKNKIYQIHLTIYHPFLRGIQKYHDGSVTFGYFILLSISYAIQQFQSVFLIKNRRRNENESAVLRRQRGENSSLDEINQWLSKK